MNNPLLIPQTLDRHLDPPVELTLYGRAALALGFPAHEPRHETTQDVDAIIPLGQLDELRADEQFWDARDATNAELAERGLYLTHPGTARRVPRCPAQSPGDSAGQRTGRTTNRLNSEPSTRRDPAFSYDVFLSHSAKDKAVVRAVAERLRQDGLKVWFDEWERPSPAGAGEGGRRPGEGRGARADSISAKIDPPPLRSYGGTGEGLEHSRVLACSAVASGRRGMLCMSANAFGSDWAQLEAGTCGRGNLPFREPLNSAFAPRLRRDEQACRFIPWRLDD